MKKTRVKYRESTPEEREQANKILEVICGKGAKYTSRTIFMPKKFFDDMSSTEISDFVWTFKNPYVRKMNKILKQMKGGK